MIRFASTFVLVVLISACDQTDQNGGGGDVGSLKARSIDDSLVARTRAEMADLPDFARQFPSLQMCKDILEQPDTTGLLREHGCIVRFDSRDEPTWAQTLSTVEYSTGARRRVREFTVDEIRANVAQLKQQLQHQRSRGVSSSVRTIPVFSRGLQLAAAEAVLNRERGVTYVIARGSGRFAEELRVIRFGTTSGDVLAADALYAVEE